MKKNELIDFRKYNPTVDDPYIYVHWLRGLRMGNPLFHLIDRNLYFENYRRIIQALLEISEVKIACLKESTDVILGFSVFQKDRVHWVYVKEGWREIGIGKDLLPTPFHSYSHITDDAQKLMKLKKIKAIFNPFLEEK